MRAIWITLAGGMLAVSMMGCSFSGGGLTLFPEGHELLDATKAVKQCAGPLPLPRERDKRPLPAYTAEPGDLLLLTVVMKPEEEDGLPVPLVLPADQRVIIDGTIDLAQYGRLQVAGKTLGQIEAEVAAAILSREKGEVDFVNVRAADYPSKMFYVLGEVIDPNLFPLEGRETVLDAILIAGGLSGRADREKIILSRPTAPDGCRVVLPICYDEIVQLGDTSTNYQLLPGDRIFVPSRAVFNFCGDDDKCTPCERPHFACPLSAIPCSTRPAILEPPMPGELVGR